MLDLSVGQVSGLIAVGVFAVQVFIPLALPAILIAFVSEENSVATWSVLGRCLHSTFWPAILQTDSATDTGVRRRVSVTGWLQTAALISISIASIVTPLGLYESVEPAKTPVAQPFGYIKDASPFGYGTPARSDAPFARYCGALTCAGGDLNETCVTKGLLEQCTVDYDNSIPDSLRDLFRDGATSFGASVSSIFDIQWRTYISATSLAGPYLRAAFRQLSVLILDESVKAYEGLIVDMVSGGIGFRNHTAPLPSLEYGSTWTEDILFIEPETECVSLNITLDFKLPLDDTSNSSVDGLVLTDRGGFSAMSRTSPRFDIAPNGQTDLHLRERAYKAAWLNNFLTMVYFNATDPDRTKIERVDVTAGATFPISSSLHDTKFRVGYATIKSNTAFGTYLNLPYAIDRNETQRNETQAKVNPFGVTTQDFDFITNTCSGSVFNSPANINSSVVGCTLLYGAANRTDAGSSLIADPGSPWSVPIYSCASAIKATIRTVTFQYNGTGLSALKINATRAKTYPSPSTLPLWAVEALPYMTLINASPLWGLLGASNSTPPPPHTNISTLSAPSLYLPDFLDQTSLLVGPHPVPSTDGQNLPGADFYVQALASALSIDHPGGNSSYQGYADYSGQTSLAMYAKWQRLSRSAAGAATILDLVWTDVAANAVVGTKGWGLRSAASLRPAADLWKRDGGGGGGAEVDIEQQQQQLSVPISVYERRIRYKIPFAIPAIVVLAAVAAVLVALATLAALGRTGLGRMRMFLEATSAGRILGRLLWPGEEAGGTKEWAGVVGGRGVGITREGIVAEEGLLEGEEVRGLGKGEEPVGMVVGRGEVEEVG